MSASNCKNCGKKIEVAIFKGSGYCSELCRKVLAGEIEQLEELRNRDIDE